MKTLQLQEFYKVFAIDERDVKTFRQLAANTIQLIFQDGSEEMIQLKCAIIIKRN